MAAPLAARLLLVRVLQVARALAVPVPVLLVVL
jgi:hypothetical protein